MIQTEGMTWWTRYKPAPRIDVSEVMELPSQSNKVVEKGNVSIYLASANLLCHFVFQFSLLNVKTCGKLSEGSLG